MVVHLPSAVVSADPVDVAKKRSRCFYQRWKSLPLGRKRGDDKEQFVRELAIDLEDAFFEAFDGKQTLSPLMQCTVVLNHAKAQGDIPWREEWERPGLDSMKFKSLSEVMKRTILHEERESSLQVIERAAESLADNLRSSTQFAAPTEEERMKLIGHGIAAMRAKANKQAEAKISTGDQQMDELATMMRSHLQQLVVLKFEDGDTGEEASEQLFRATLLAAFIAHLPQASSYDSGNECFDDGDAPKLSSDDAPPPGLRFAKTPALEEQLQAQAARLKAERRQRVLSPFHFVARNVFFIITAIVLAWVVYEYPHHMAVGGQAVWTWLQAVAWTMARCFAASATPFTMSQATVGRGAS